MIFPVHHTFAPHVDLRYLLRSCVLLLQPWKWKNGNEREGLRCALAQHFHAECSLFASGREGLFALLQAIGDQPGLPAVAPRGAKAGGEIIVQAFTCQVLPNAIVAAGMTPVYAEIEPGTLNMDPADAERKLTPKTRAILCQHTFGIPADTHRLRALCDRYGVLLIEDCAHTLPDAQGPVTIGRDGDVILLSFGRDKAISGITGGAILSHKPDLAVKLRAKEGSASSLSLMRIKRLLLYPLVYFLARPLYGMGIGKPILVLARTIGALVPILTNEEKQGHMEPIFHCMPNACCALALAEFKNVKEINDHRRKLTSLYFSAFAHQQRSEETSHRNNEITFPKAIHPQLPLQKFPLFVRGAEEIRRRLKKQNIHLQDGWTGCVICPPGSPLEEAHYVPGSDPKAEFAAQMILSLPTHPTMTERQAKRLIDVLTFLLCMDE